MADRHVRRRDTWFSLASRPSWCASTCTEIHLTSGRGDRYRDQRHDRLVGRKSPLPTREPPREWIFHPGPFGRSGVPRPTESEGRDFVDLHSRNVCRVAGLTRELRIRNIRFTCDRFTSPLPLRVQRVHVSIASAHPRHISYVNYSAREKQSRWKEDRGRVPLRNRLETKFSEERWLHEKTFVPF